MARGAYLARRRVYVYPKMVVGRFVEWGLEGWSQLGGGNNLIYRYVFSKTAFPRDYSFWCGLEMV